MPAKGKKTAPAKTSPAKKTASKKSTSKIAAPVPTPAPEPVSAPEVAVDSAGVANEPVSVSDSLQSEFTELVTTLNGLKSVVSSLSSRLKGLEKKCLREMKAALKSKRKRGTSGQPRKPSGFVKPTLITDELATFLNRESGSMMARTEVTREINKYIREHKLQDPENGRVIHPDAALRSLLNVKKNEELTYFNLQRYMSPHFKKSAPATA